MMHTFFAAEMASGLLIWDSLTLLDTHLSVFEKEVLRCFVKANLRKRNEDSNANYGFGVIIMCQRRFINCKKYFTLLGDADNGGDCACGRG